MPRPAPSPITIAAIKALPEAAEGERTWVNGVITVTVHEVSQMPKNDAVIVKASDSSGKMQFNFWKRQLSTLQQYVGTTIKITGQGISRSSREYNGRTTLSVNVPDKASIQIVGDSASSQGTATQGRGVSAQSTAYPEKTTVRTRVHAYLNVLAEVHAQVIARQDLPDITPSDEKDIAAYINLTYDNRENYQAPLLKKADPPKQPEPPAQEDFSGGFDPGQDDVPFLCAWKELGTGVF